MKDIQIVNNNTNTSLKKATSLVNITDDILDSESWIDRVWSWADENNLNDSIIPKDKDRLLSLSELYIDKAHINTPFKGCSSENFNRLLNRKEDIPLVFIDELFNLENITEITISMRELAYLPESISSFKNLTKLDLFSNMLETLPNSIGELTELTSLTIMMNLIETLPKSIVNLKKLKYLGIWLDETTLSEEQEKWIKELELNGCEIDD